ncbi:MAG: DUF952 domain-containing protein [Acidimicrobiales bacterium]
MLYHLTTHEEWDRACQAEMAGSYVASSLVDQGFIHLSQPSQLLLAADSHYRHRADLVVLVIDQEVLDPAALVFEAGSAPNAHRIFPHLYGPLPLSAVRAVVPFPCGSDGHFAWPLALGEDPG